MGTSNSVTTHFETIVNSAISLAQIMPKKQVVSFFIELFGKTLPVLINLLDGLVVTKSDFVNRVPLPSKKQVEYFFDRNSFFLVAFSKQKVMQSTIPLASRIALYQEILENPSFMFLTNHYPELDATQLVRYLDDVKSGYIQLIYQALHAHGGDAIQSESLNTQLNDVTRKLHVAILGLLEEDVLQKDIAYYANNLKIVLS